MKAITVPNPTLYDQDYYAWVLAQVRALADRRPEDIDWARLAEEVEDLGRSRKTEVANRLRILIVHLLKWRHQFELRSVSWEVTIGLQRDEIVDLLEESPSLRPLIRDEMGRVYSKAVRKAAVEAVRFEGDFPDICPFTLDQCLDSGFWPQDLDPPGFDWR